MPTHFPLEGLYLVVGGLIVPPKGNAACTAAILDFLSCHHHYICVCVKPFQKGVLEGNDPKCIGSFLQPTSFQIYFSLSVKIIAGESTFFCVCWVFTQLQQTHSKCRIHKL